jgi:hypothetical protein
LQIGSGICSWSLEQVLRDWDREENTLSAGDSGGLRLGAAASLHAQPYTFDTLAGNPLIVKRHGNPLGSYADGTNSDARFSRPEGAAVDSAGKL